MHRWLARFAQTLLLVSCLGVQPASAHETPLCDGLHLLERLPGHARRLVVAPGPASARSAYLTDIERASIRFDRGASDAIPAEMAEAGRQAVWLHRRLLTLTDAGNVVSANHLIESRDWRRIGDRVEEQLRLLHCDETVALEHPDGAPAGIAAPLPPNGIAASSHRQTDGAVHRLQDPAVQAGGLLSLLSAIAAVVVGADLLVRRRDRRESLRFSCYISGAMQGHLYCEATEVLDISRTGCKLRLHDRLAPERPLTLFLGHRTIRARAIWSNTHYAGLKFDERLTAAQLRDILDHAGRHDNGIDPPVPALPCHDGTCRTTCLKYKIAQQEKARIRDTPGRGVDASK